MEEEQALNAEGLEIVDYYHSHPVHPASYADFDRNRALPQMSYLITAVKGQAPLTTTPDPGACATTGPRWTKKRLEPNPPEERPMVVENAIPTAPHSHISAPAHLAVEGDAVAEALDALTATHIGLANHLRDDIAWGVP